MSFPNVDILGRRITNAVKSCWSILRANEGEVRSILHSPGEILGLCESSRLRRIVNRDLAKEWPAELQDIIRDLQTLNVATNTLERGIQLFESLESIEIDNLCPTPRTARAYILACVLLADISHRPLPSVAQLSRQLNKRWPMLRYQGKKWARILIFLDSWMQLPDLLDFIRIDDQKVRAGRCIVSYREPRLPEFNPSLKEIVGQYNLQAFNRKSSTTVTLPPPRIGPSKSSPFPPSNRVGRFAASLLKEQRKSTREILYQRPVESKISAMKAKNEISDLESTEFSNAYSPLPSRRLDNDVIYGEPSKELSDDNHVPVTLNITKARIPFNEPESFVSRQLSSNAYPLMHKQFNTYNGSQISLPPRRQPSHGSALVAKKGSRDEKVELKKVAPENDKQTSLKFDNPGQVSSTQAEKEVAQEPRKRKRVPSYKPKDTRTPRFSVHGDMPNPFLPDAPIEEKDNKALETANPYDTKPVSAEERPKSRKIEGGDDKPKKRVSFADDEGFQLENVQKVTNYEDLDYNELENEDFEDSADSEYEDHTDSDWVSTDYDFNSDDSEDQFVSEDYSDSHTVDYEDETDTSGLRTYGTSTEYTTEYTTTATGYTTDERQTDEYESDSSLPVVNMSETSHGDNGDQAEATTPDYETFHSDESKGEGNESSSEHSSPSEEHVDSIEKDGASEGGEEKENETVEEEDGGNDDEEENDERDEKSEKNWQSKLSTLEESPDIVEKPKQKTKLFKRIEKRGQPVSLLKTSRFKLSNEVSASANKPSRRMASMQRKGGVPHRSPRAAGLRVSPRGFKSASSTWAAPGTPFDILIASVVAIAAPHLSIDGKQQYDQSLRAALTVAAGGDIESGVQDALVLAPTTLNEEEEKRLEEAVRAAAKEAAQSAPPSLSSHRFRGTERPVKEIEKRKTSKKTAMRARKSRKDIAETVTEASDEKPLQNEDSKLMDKGSTKSSTKKESDQTVRSKAVSFKAGTKAGKTSKSKLGVGPARRNSRVVEAKRNSGKPGPAKRGVTKPKRRGLVARIAELKNMADDAEKSKAPPSARALRAARRNGQVL